MLNVLYEKAIKQTIYLFKKNALAFRKSPVHFNAGSADDGKFRPFFSTRIHFGSFGDFFVFSPSWSCALTRPCVVALLLQPHADPRLLKQIKQAHQWIRPTGEPRAPALPMHWSPRARLILPSATLSALRLLALLFKHAPPVMTVPQQTTHALAAPSHLPAMPSLHVP